MAKKRPSHERQARLGAVLAVIGLACAAMLAVCVFWRFDFHEFAAIFRMGSPRFIALAGSGLVGLVASTVGFFVSLASAGNKRNELAPLAWKAFFANAAALFVTLSLMIVFFFARQPV